MDIRCYMGGCQNYGPFLGTLNIRCRTILRTPKGTIILTTTHMPTSTVHQTSAALKVLFLPPSGYLIPTVDGQNPA